MIVSLSSSIEFCYGELENKTFKVKEFSRETAPTFLIREKGITLEGQKSTKIGGFRLNGTFFRLEIILNFLRPHSTIIFFVLSLDPLPRVLGFWFLIGFWVLGSLWVLGLGSFLGSWVLGLKSSPIGSWDQGPGSS